MGNKCKSLKSIENTSDKNFMQAGHSLDDIRQTVLVFH